MKRYSGIIWIVLLFCSCLRENNNGDDCRTRLLFDMKDVSYVYEEDEAIGYRPYYVFTEQLDLFLFSVERIDRSFRFDYKYCKTHPVIPVDADVNSGYYLFVANLFDPRELNWAFDQGKLKAWFSIVDYEEPPVLLAADSNLTVAQGTIPVSLRMLVSRLEIRLTNPPAWVKGLDVNVRNIAGTVSTDFSLGDTTHIYKQIGFDNHGPGVYEFGVNTFPTYAGKTALLRIDFIGTTEVSPILVDDSHLNLLPGVITLLNIEFEGENKITVSVEVNGKWEIVDGGTIII